MSWKSFCFALLMCGAVALPGRAALLISEVLFNEVGSDVTGEWIEIFNGGPSTIDLSNYKIGDEETSGGTSATESLYQFPAGAMIAPGEVQIVSMGATRFLTVYGFSPTYESASTDPSVPDMAVYTTWDSDGGTINMSNTNDQAILVDATDTIIDAASWGSSTFAFDPALGSAVDGQSYQRKNAFIDTNTADDWEAGPNPDGSTAASRSTPGTVPIPEPATATLAALAVVALVRGRFRR